MLRRRAFSAFTRVFNVLWPPSRSMRGVTSPYPSRRAHARLDLRQLYRTRAPQDEDGRARGSSPNRFRSFRSHDVKQPISFPRRMSAPGVRHLPSLTPNRGVGGAPKGASCIVVAPVKARVSRVCETRRASCEACLTRSPLGAPPRRFLATSPLRLRIISGNALNERGFCFSSTNAIRSQ